MMTIRSRSIAALTLLFAAGATASCGSSTSDEPSFGSDEGGAGASGGGGAGGEGGSAGQDGGTAGSGGSSGSGGSGGAGGCTTAAQCTDGIACTVDTCAAGQCSHSPGPNTGATACPPGQYCTLTGCVGAPACANDAQCIAQWGADACKTNVRCEPATSTCQFDLLDKDHDGQQPVVCGGGDCNDNDPQVFAGSPEICDGKDDDCNGKVDDGAKCQGLATCTGGACICPPANACGGACVDKQTDMANCGACGNACPSGATCTAGTCQCSASSTVCNGACVDKQTDPSNCGSCGSSCAPGYSCSGGLCACTKTSCGGVCIDTTADPNNCGGCNVKCGAGLSCVGGSCQCAANQTKCSGVCVDLKTDPNNCNACGTKCTGGCSNGQCVACNPGGILILFDHSGSMTTALSGSTVTRFAAEQAAVNAFVQDSASNGLTVAVQQHAVGVACSTTTPCTGFGDSCVNGHCSLTDSCVAADYANPVVAAGLLPGVASAIVSTVSALAAETSSPTDAALQGGILYAQGWMTAHPGKKMAVVLLADSAVPTNCSSALATVVANAAAGLAGSPSVKSYVISFGSAATTGDPAASFDQIAAAGGTVSAFDTLEAGQTAVQSALNTIRGAMLCP